MESHESTFGSHIDPLRRLKSHKLPINNGIFYCQVLRELILFKYRLPTHSRPEHPQEIPGERWYYNNFIGGKPEPET